MMNTVKARKVGNSTTITIPKELKVRTGQEYTVYKGIDGVIVFAPKMKNPLAGMEPFRMEDEFAGLATLDSEVS